MQNRIIYLWDKAFDWVMTKEELKVQHAATRPLEISSNLHWWISKMDYQLDQWTHPQNYFKSLLSLDKQKRCSWARIKGKYDPEVKNQNNQDIQVEGFLSHLIQSRLAHRSVHLQRVSFDLTDSVPDSEKIVSMIQEVIPSTLHLSAKNWSPKPKPPHSTQ